ncbi:MAG: hypothetical protein ABTQ34_01225 [Bdellovibrionales bacterium]|jgi:hypothetical protein
MLVGPGVQVKPIEGDALRSDGNYGQVGAYFGDENLSVHAEIGRGVAHADEAGIH